MPPKLMTYYNLKNSGDDHLYHYKDTGKALVFYDSAFNYFVSNFDSSFCEVIPDLYRLHATQGNSKKVYEYIRHSILINHSAESPEFFTPSEWGKREEYKAFRNSKYWKLFVEEHDSLYRSATSSLNWNLLSEYSAIAQIDQVVRQDKLATTKKLCAEKGYDCDKIASALMYDLDIINLRLAIDLIKENGFLEYSETGGQIGILSNVLIHSFRSCFKDSSLRWTYDFLDSVLLSKVFSGKYPPAVYAFFKDRSYSYLCSVPQKYGYWPVNNGGSIEIKYGLQDVKNVDKRRAEIGLPPLYIHSLKGGVKLPAGYEIPKKYKM